MFSVKQSFGHLVCSMNCGIMVGAAPLYEAEGMREVASGLNEIWRVEDQRPEIMFYDCACLRTLYLGNNPDEGAGWAGTRNYVDRWHNTTHVGAFCQEMCSPEKRDDPLLWRVDGAGEHHWMWNSSIQESNNCYLHGFGHVVNPMPRALGQFVLNMNICMRNEMLLRDKLLGLNPTFNA